MNKAEFLLPDDLGWECNDRISAYIDEWIQNTIKYLSTRDSFVWTVAKAELMDNIYLIIKECQDKEKRVSSNE